MVFWISSGMVPCSLSVSFPRNPRSPTSVSLLSALFTNQSQLEAETLRVSRLTREILIQFWQPIMQALDQIHNIQALNHTLPLPHAFVF